MLTRTEEIMREVCADFEAELKQFNGEQDHVHLLVHYPPKRDPAYPGGQRFLATGRTTYPVGGWYDVRVEQRGRCCRCRWAGRRW